VIIVAVRWYLKYPLGPQSAGLIGMSLLYLPEEEK